MLRSSRPCSGLLHQDRVFLTVLGSSRPCSGLLDRALVFKTATPAFPNKPLWNCRQLGSSEQNIPTSKQTRILQSHQHDCDLHQTIYVLRKSADTKKTDCKDMTVYDRSSLRFGFTRRRRKPASVSSLVDVRFNGNRWRRNRGNFGNDRRRNNEAFGSRIIAQMNCVSVHLARRAWTGIKIRLVSNKTQRIGRW